MAARKNPGGGVKTDKPWREALMIACKRPVPKGEKGERYLARIADKVVKAAAEGDIQAAKEIGDRLDGKAVQGIVGGDGGPIQVTWMPPGES